MDGFFGLGIAFSVFFSIASIFCSVLWIWYHIEGIKFFRKWRKAKDE